MRLGDRYDLIDEGLHGAVTFMEWDEMTGDMLLFVVQLDAGGFAGVVCRDLPCSPTVH